MADRKFLGNPAKGLPRSSASWQQHDRGSDGRARLTVLAEDEFLICLIVAEELAEDGDGAAVLIETRSGTFTLLVTGIHLPGTFDGITVVCRLLEHRPDIPVIYITGQPGVLNGAGLENKDVLLRKPFVPSGLLAVVRRSLGGGGASGC